MTATRAPDPSEYRIDFDVSGPDSLSTAVVYATCAVVGVDPATAPPLADVIDTSSLDRLFRGSTRVGEDGTTEIRFHYMQFEVTVHSQGWIRVRDPHWNPSGFRVR